jgi:hypothetical protein
MDPGCRCPCHDEANAKVRVRLSGPIPIVPTCPKGRKVDAALASIIGAAVREGRTALTPAEDARLEALLTAAT